MVPCPFKQNISKICITNAKLFLLPIQQNMNTNERSNIHSKKHDKRPIKDLRNLTVLSHLV